MTVKSLLPFLVIGATLTHGHAFATSIADLQPNPVNTEHSKELISAASPVAVKKNRGWNWNCCTRANLDVIEQGTIEVGTAALGISKIAFERSAAKITIQLIQKKYSDIPATLLEAVVYALETYKANHKNAQTAIDVLAAVGSVASDSLEKSDGKSLNKNAGDYIKAAFSTLSVPDGSDQKGKIKAAAFHLMGVLVNDLADDNKINGSNKGEYIEHFAEIIDLLEPSSNQTDTKSAAQRAAITMVKGLFTDLLNGKKDKDSLIQSIQQSLGNFDSGNREVNLIIKAVNVALAIASGKEIDQTIIQELLSIAEEKITIE